jgi:hypothetical protein
VSDVTVKVVIDNDDHDIDDDDDDENDDDYESHYLQYIITIMIIVYHLDQHIRQLYAACFLLSDLHIYNTRCPLFENRRSD